MDVKDQYGDKNPNFKHGKSSNNQTYKVWVQLRRRCRERKWYVSRGITVCERWQSFTNFLEDMGPRPEGLVLDRINNDLGYSPDNCRWTTPKVNANNRTNNLLITLDGITRTAAQWSEELGIPRVTISWRARNGWNPERILST